MPRPVWPVPGFIDAHVHAEGPLQACGRVEEALAQGVTTLVVGQDGQSWIGATAATMRYLNRYFAPVNGALEPARDLSVAAYRDAVAGGLAQNVAVLASQGTIRHNIAGLAPGPVARQAERAAARREVENALADGAVGLSSGLDYLPSRFGGAGEVSEIALPLAAAGRPYVSHLRSYGPDVEAGLAELAGVGRGAGIRVHASHLWGSPDGIEEAFRLADAAGVRITYDAYPYRKASTILASLLLPADLQAHGLERTLAALADPAERAALLTQERFSDEFLQDVYLGCLPASAAKFAGSRSAGRQPWRPVAGRVGSRPAARCWTERRRTPGPAYAHRRGPGVARVRRTALRRLGRHLPRPAPPSSWIRRLRLSRRAVPGRRATHRIPADRPPPVCERR